MTFYETLSAAIDDVLRHGFDSQRRLDDWVRKIRAAAKAHLVPEKELDKALRNTLSAIYKRMIGQGQIWKYHAVDRFTIKNLKPSLHAELQRRIMASANLIKLNRERMIEDTVQRFSGWMSSVPAGGSKAQSKAETKASIKKPLARLPFEERRVLIDQGHKFVSSLNDIIAKDGNAIAARWHSNWRQKGYNYREDHKERDTKVYLIRDSWAHQKGLVKPGKAGYFDAITQPGEEVFCRCSVVYLYGVSELPDDMLTAKGRAALEKIKEAT